MNPNDVVVEIVDDVVVGLVVDVVVVLVVVVVDVLVVVVVDVVVVAVVVVVVVAAVVVVASCTGRLDITTGTVFTAATKSSKSISIEVNGFINGAEKTFPVVSGTPAGKIYK